MSELLLEILSEEIPSRFHKLIQKQFLLIAQKEFSKQKLEIDGAEVHVAPRRLVFCCSDVMQGKIEPRRGPQISANQGAIDGFARSCGVSVKSLHVKKVNDIDYYFSPADTSNNSIVENICKSIERSLLQISWPKSMYWNDSHLRWVRPVRNVMAILGSKILPLEFCHLKANNLSCGHKIMRPDSFVVKSFKQYKEQLRSNKVLLTYAERKDVIIDGINDISRKLGVRAVQDHSLLEEIIGLVEYPVVRYGKIDNKFLSLPSEVIIKIMSSHQKFVALEYPDGKLSPYFVTVLNIESDAEKDIIDGNEKVLSARLYDGKFFFDEDLKISLLDRVNDLKRVVFHDQLGSLFEKVERIEKLAIYLSGFVDLDDGQLKRVALLSKADLTTYMVNEFPELQGVVGQYYAQHGGENNVVSQAICEHYLPIGKDSVVPTSPYGALVSIADKLDTIAGLFLINELPTSSKDPYALRRCALGIIRIICISSFNVDLDALVRYSFDLYQRNYNDHSVKKVIEFIYERFRFWLKADIRDDLVSSVLSLKSCNISRDYQALMFLDKVLKENKELFLVFKRVNNIVQANDAGEISEQFLMEHEAQLLNEVVLLERSVEDFYNTNNPENLYSVLVDIEKTVGNIFNDTMILDKNLEIRKHRVAVLKKLDASSKKIADFSLIDL